MSSFLRLSSLLIAAVISCAILSAWPRAQPSSPSNPFDLPTRKRALAGEVAGLFQRGAYGEAERRLRDELASDPLDVTAHYLLACAMARQGESIEALDSLDRAVELGFRNPDQIAADPDLETLRSNPRFQRLVNAARRPLPSDFWWSQAQPAPVDRGRTQITADNIVYDSRWGLFHAVVDRSNAGAGRPAAHDLGEVGEWLNRWHAEGTAAGNVGDLYDNHDAGHSRMRVARHPQLTQIEFAAAARERGLHRGWQRYFVFNGVTIGNSSTALTGGPFWRSTGRLALTQPGGPELLYLQYRRNHLYVYPEHRDHDAERDNGRRTRGDVFPANTPYMLITQGSSGSDREVLSAMAMTLAAFHPQVKQQLAERGMLMAAVQMVLRSSNPQRRSPEDYLTGRAHPTAFRDDQFDPATMVTIAHEMTEATLPPLARIQVIEEDLGVVGRDYFDAGPRERLFDTPCAVARVVKSTSYWHRMVVSAELSEEVNNLPLTYHWRVLRGDAEAIEMHPRNPDGSVVELRIPYHRRRPVQAESGLESNRVDVGLFVHNGHYYSAPAFISLQYLDNEHRVYDDRQRIQIVDYGAAGIADRYVDPVLDARKDWRDEYDYDEDGSLRGWTRIRGEQRESFTPDGRLVVATDERGQPRETVAVRYRAERQDDGTSRLIQFRVAD